MPAARQALRVELTVDKINSKKNLQSRLAMKIFFLKI
jgi:hypothetical protein